MAAPPPRARADYDYLIKLLLIGDSARDIKQRLLDTETKAEASAIRINQTDLAAPAAQRSACCGS